MHCLPRSFLTFGLLVRERKGSLGCVLHRRRDQPLPVAGQDVVDVGVPVVRRRDASQSAANAPSHGHREPPTTKTLFSSSVQSEKLSPSSVEHCRRIRPPPAA
ncbi:hypothetical protein V8G54_018225 [Vigna mungo]|uniref:Uncharacterized protein n=1 Tax=Vigna mungo TaxID=3915 RepID=A0AAQ3RUD7_VIGMU